MTTEARADHIRRAAAELVLVNGVGSVTMKAVARGAGISEALAYRYFPSALDLLADMARREQALMAQMQAEAVLGLHDYSARARASMVGFLDYVEERRGLLQALLSHAELRRLLNAEHRSRIAANTETYAARLQVESGVPLEVGAPGWQILRAAATRAGKLLASHKVSREQAGRLASAVMDGARERLIAWVDPEVEGSAAADRTRPRP
jgi:AcrR family transcriptional regulator